MTTVGAPVRRLAEWAAVSPDARLAALGERLGAPVRVSVAGRVGVGVATLVAAVRRAMPAVTVAEGAGGDVRVLAVAERLTPEDWAVLASDGSPHLVVLTKADLSGADLSGAGGPLAVAAVRAARIALATGVPTVSVDGLLAALDDLDDELLGALAVLVDVPAEIATVDAFVEHPHPVTGPLRARLLDRLDRFGVAHAVLALGGGTAPADLAAHLRRVGGIEALAAALEPPLAEVRYRRLRDVLDEHQRAQAGDPASDTRDAPGAAHASAAAAADVLRAAGLDPGGGDVAAAIRWRRYARGPVGVLHRRCAEDLVRDAMRPPAPTRAPGPR